MHIDDTAGSVWFVPDLYFNIYHHYAFKYNSIRNKMEFNANPYGDAKYIKIDNFTVTESGFSFLKENNKRVTKCHDRTPFEKQLSKELSYLISNFCFLDGYYTGFRGTWSLTEAPSLTFVSKKNGYSSDHLALEHRGRRNKFKIFYHPKDEIIQVSTVSFKDDEIYLMTSKGEIHYDYNLNPHLKSFVKFYLTNGFSKYIKNEDGICSSTEQFTIYADC